MTAMVRMLDVSANNHTDDQPIDWKKVKGGGYGAVMIKATEGVGYANPWLKPDADGATSAGLSVGFYHFAHPGNDAPLAEAVWALSVVRGLHHDLGLALDLEVTEGLSWGALKHFAQVFHGRIRTEFEHSPLYCNDYFLNGLAHAPWGWRVWLAQTDRPRRAVWAWQETTPADIPGIVGGVDVGWLHPDA